MLGAILTTAVALICSLFYGFNDPKTISPELITPLLRKIIHKGQDTTPAKTVLPATVKDTEF